LTESASALRWLSIEPAPGASPASSSIDLEGAVMVAHKFPKLKARISCGFTAAEISYFKLIGQTPSAGLLLTVIASMEQAGLPTRLPKGQRVGELLRRADDRRRDARPRNCRGDRKGPEEPLPNKK
jgi:hypothetical protein